MHSQDALSAYRHTSVETESATGLIVELYEGILRFVREAEAALAEGDVPRKASAIQRASRIVQELGNALDFEAAEEISAQLTSLYDYLGFELSEANIRNDAHHLANVTKVTEILLVAWRRVHREHDASADGPTLDAAPHPTGAPHGSLEISA